MKAIGAMIAACLALSPTAQAENSVVVESKTVYPYPGRPPVTVGIWVANSVELTGFVLPLEFRDTDGNGSYITGPNSSFSGFKVVAGHRLGSSPLTGSVIKYKYASPTANTCSGPLSQTYPAPSAHVDYISPDGLLLAMVSQGAPHGAQIYWLPPGDDHVAGIFPNWPEEDWSTDYEAGPSFTLTFSINAVPGTFEVDSCCSLPNNHLSGTDLNTNLVLFSFTMGVITIDPAACACPCFTDTKCDGIKWDVFDVVRTLEVAFRGWPPVQSENCPRQDTDVNCSGGTDVIDVVLMGNVAFRGASAAATFCAPCAP